MRLNSHTLVRPDNRRTRCAQVRLLKNGAAAHEFTHEDRAKGGRARAEKMRRRKELRERFEVAGLEDLVTAELGLLDRALVRLGLLVASDDDRVAWRACKEVFDRVLGRPGQRQEHRGSIESRHVLETELVQTRERLAVLVERHASKRE
jgi:hypothetical protein